MGFSILEKENSTPNYSLTSTPVRPVFTFEIGAERNKQQSAQKKGQPFRHVSSFIFFG